MTLIQYDNGSRDRVVIDESAAVAQLALWPSGKLRARPGWIVEQSSRRLQNPVVRQCAYGFVLRTDCCECAEAEMWNFESWHDS